MHRLKLKLTAVQIELNWWLIRRERQKGARLLRKGLSLSSKRMLKLNHSFSKHCAMAMKAQRDYERLAGVSGFNPKLQV